MTLEYAETARAAGDEVDLELPEGADHVDVVDPEGPAVEMVAGVILALVSET